jgi:excisionase family DNA binding protein
MSNSLTISRSNEDPLLDYSEADSYLRLPKGTTKNWISEGRYEKVLTPTRLGRRVFFRKSVLERFLKACTVSA